MGRQSVILDQYERPIERMNGKPRRELFEAAIAANPFRRRAQASYDAARDSTETQNHWAHADSLDSDAANRREVRDRLRSRSRYEAGSNAYYDGPLSTHVNMLVGVGPTLRMLTDDREWNQQVEKDFYDWAEKIQLARKLWCLCHAYVQDGEGFGLLQTNPMLDHQVQLDVMLLEAEQCQTPRLPYMERGYTDGIRFDDFNNILHYDILPTHPGSSQHAAYQDPVPVGPREVLHWFKLKRPGAHRGVPACTSSLNTGANSRRWREAILAAAETAADISVLLESAYPPSEDDLDPLVPLSALQFQKRMMVTLPNSVKAHQMESEHPNATHESFHRSLVAEGVRPLGQPINVAQGDSSNYSFASGKLDTICYRAEINIERAVCDLLILNRIFRMWFAEYVLVTGRLEMRGESAHQWDWPRHPVIDEESDARANETKLRTGTTSLRQVYSDAGEDYDDALEVQARDTFGEVNDENVDKMRKINALKNTPGHAIAYVAVLLGVQLPAAERPSASPSRPKIAPEAA